MEHESISSDSAVSSQKPTDSGITHHLVASGSESGSKLTTARSQIQQMSQPSKLQRTRRKEPKNVLTRIEKITEGPLVVLKKALVEKRRVKVLIRTAVQMRGICTGFVVVFDRHMNLVLSDVDEVYRNPLLLYRRESKGTDAKKKKKKQRKRQFKADSQKSLSAESTEVTQSVGEMVESSLSLHVDSTERGSHFGALNLDGQYDTSSEEESEEQFGAAAAEDQEDDASKVDCEIKSPDENLKGHSSGTSETFTSEVFSQKHETMKQHDEKTGYRIAKVSSAYGMHPRRPSSRSSDDALSSGKGGRSREYHFKSRSPDAVFDSFKDRTDSTENLRDVRRIHGAREYRRLSHSHERSGYTGNRTGDKGLAYSAMVKQINKAKDYAANFTRNQGHVGHDTGKHELPEGRMHRSERSRHRITSERESSSTRAGQGDLRNKPVSKAVGSSTCKKFETSHLHDEHGEPSLIEGKDSRAQSTDEKHRLIKTKLGDIERTVTEVHSQTKQSDHSTSDTCINQRTDSLTAGKTKQTTEVLKRSVNKLFIRGDNVVMVVLEE